MACPATAVSGVESMVILFAHTGENKTRSDAITVAVICVSN